MMGGCGKNELPSMRRARGPSGGGSGGGTLSYPICPVAGCEQPRGHEAHGPAPKPTGPRPAVMCEALVEHAYSQALTAIRAAEHDIKFQHSMLEQLSPEAMALAQQLLADLAQVLRDADERVQGQRTLMRTHLTKLKTAAPSVERE